MSSNEVLEQLVVDLSSNPVDPEKNLRVAAAYESMNQLAAAVGFYLRAAEYGYQTHPAVTYSALLRVHVCLNTQTDRDHTSSTALLHAIGYIPSRPEAYMLMSKFHESKGNWPEAYSYAVSGEMVMSIPAQPLPLNAGYEGDYCLLFQKAIGAWWIGRRDEAKNLLMHLLSRPDLSAAYQEAVKYNLEKINE